MATGQLYIETRVVQFINKSVRLILISGLGISRKTCSSSTVFIFFPQLLSLSCSAALKEGKARGVLLIFEAAFISPFFFFCGTRWPYLLSMVLLCMLVWFLRISMLKCPGHPALSDCHFSQLTCDWKNCSSVWESSGLFTRSFAFYLGTFLHLTAFCTT